MDISETPHLNEVYSRQLTFFALFFYILFTNYEQRSWHVEITIITKSNLIFRTTLAVYLFNYLFNYLFFIS